MVWAAVQVLPPAQARKQQGALDLVLPFVHSVPLQHGRQVFGGGLGIPKVELHQLAFLQQLADGQDTGTGVDTHHISNQEIALLRRLYQLVHHHSQEQRVAHQFLVPAVYPPEQLLHHGQGRLPFQPRQQVAPALSNPHGPANGAAALGHDGIHGDVSVEGQPNGPGAAHLAVQKQGIPPLLVATAGQSADLGGPGEREVQPHQKVLHLERKGVRQHDELGILSGGYLSQFFPSARPGVRIGKVFLVQVEAHNLHAGQDGGGYGHGRPLLHLQAASNDTAAGTTEDPGGGQVLLNVPGHVVVVPFIVGGDEDHRQVRRQISQPGPHAPGTLFNGTSQVCLFRNCRSPIHLESATRP